jgi:hypothetical protein
VESSDVAGRGDVESSDVVGRGDVESGDVVGRGDEESMVTPVKVTSTSDIDGVRRAT